MAMLRRVILSSQVKSAASSGTAVKGIANAQVLSGKSKSLMDKNNSVIANFKIKKY